MIKINYFYDEEEKSTKFELLVPYTFEWNNECYTINEGFISDGGSIPQHFWNICSPTDGRFIEAYIIHDYCYSGKIKEMTRKDADKLLKSNLQTSGMGTCMSNTIYWCVRLFGKSHWIEYKEETK